MTAQLIIQSNGELYEPTVMSGITWATERKGVPGKLTFTVVKDSVEFAEGDPVRLTVGDAKIFYGFIFSQKRGKEQHISVTAYDQLRYLTNKDVFNLKDMTAGDIIRKLATDFKLNVGDIESTSFNIKRIKESNSSLFDVILKALDFELTNNKQMYVLFDDFGKLTLKSLDNMKLDVLIDAESAENFEYSSSIDKDVYNQIKLVFDNEKSGSRDIYMTKDGNNINTWGVLRYFDTLKEGENGQNKADALLNLYNVKTQTLKISKAIGDARVRAGSLVAVQLKTGGIELKNYMLVEKCTHTFNESYHTMDLTLRGGAVNA